jgi:Peptidase inhibitor family I36
MLHSLKLLTVIAGVTAIAAVAAVAAPAGAAPQEPNCGAPQRPQAESIASLPSAVAAARAVPQAVRDGACNEGDACLWYLSDFRGSVYDNSHNEPNLVNNRFISAGLGQLAQVGNDAESVFNQDGAVALVVCTGPNYTGTCGTVPPFTGGTLTSTYFNNVESFYWADSAN